MFVSVTLLYLSHSVYLSHSTLSQSLYSIAPQPCLFTHSQSHSHIHSLSPVLILVEIKGTQDHKISHAHSLILTLLYLNRLALSQSLCLVTSFYFWQINSSVRFMHLTLALCRPLGLRAIRLSKIILTITSTPMVLPHMLLLTNHTASTVPKSVH